MQCFPCGLQMQELMRNEQDIAFLASMKGDRVATIGALDAKYIFKVKRRGECEVKAKVRQAHAVKEQQEISAPVNSGLLQSDVDSTEDEIVTSPAKEPTQARRLEPQPLFHLTF